MKKPEPVLVKKKTFDTYDYDLPELSPISPEYAKIVLPPTVEAPEVNEVLTSFYTITFKGILGEKLEDVSSRLIDLLSYARNKYKVMRNRITREFADKIRELNSSFGIANHIVISGEYQKKLYDLHKKELEEERELYMRIIDECKDLVSRSVNTLLDTIADTNQLYRDIFERDFRITFDTYRLILENNINKYNEYLSDLNVFLQIAELYRNTFNELVNIERRRFESIRWALEKEEIKEIQKEAINEYLEAYERFLLEYERLLYLEYEEYEILIRKYEAELRKYRTQIERVNNIIELINTNIAKYRVELEKAEAELRIKDAKLDTTMSKIRTYRSMLDAKEAEIRAEIAKARAEVEIFGAQIERFEGEIRKYNANVEKIVTEYEKEILDLELDLAKEEEKLVEYLKAELAVREEYLKILKGAIIENRKRGIINMFRSRRELERIEVGRNAVIEFNRTMAQAYSSVTATIVRQFG